MSGVANKLMSAAGGGVDPAWDLSYAYYDPTTAWDVSTAVYANKQFTQAIGSSAPAGVFFKPDGLKMYTVCYGNNLVREHNLSTAWSVNTASFLQSFDASAQETELEGILLKPDGLKMYIIGSGVGGYVNEYDLSTAWDISSASYLQNFSVAAQDAFPRDFFFKPDGTKMYVMGGSIDTVYEYNLSTPWDISSASYLQNFSVAAKESIPYGIAFKPDGTKMYVTGGTGGDVNEYNLSTAWDISSATYLQVFSVVAQASNPSGIFFKPDGTVFYITDTSTDRVYQYTLGGFSVAAQETSPQGLFFKPDGLKMYITGSAGDDVNEYNLSTAWDVSTASFLQLFSVAAQENAPAGLFFKPDGTKMYVIGLGGVDINEYDLSTAWDVSTASFLQNFSVSAQDTAPTGVFLKPNGLKVYVIGRIGDAVYEYDLSTAWDVSSATFLQNFSVAAQETGPTSVFFKPDGTKMYITGFDSDNVNEYDLSTAWGVSTASFVQSFSVAAQEAGPQAVSFRDDGTQMFMVGSLSDAVFSYTLGVQP